MSSGDFNNLSLRNTTSYNPDGSFVSTGYVFTVSTNGRQLWTNNLNLNQLSASTLSLNSSFTINNLIVNSSIQVSSLNSQNIQFSTLTGAVGQITSLGVSSLTGSSLVGVSGQITSLGVSSLTGSSLVGVTGQITSLGVSSLTGSSLVGVTGQITSLGVSSLTGSSLVGVAGQINSFSVSTLTGSSFVMNGGTVQSTLAVSTLSTNLLFANSGTVNSTLTVSTLISQLLQYSSLIGSSIYTTTASISTLTVSSVIASGGFGATGPTGPGGSGGGGGGGTGYTGPAGPTGASGITAMISRQPTVTQSIPLGSTNNLVIWDTLDATQSQGNTGLTYSAGIFTNNTTTTLPVNVDYTLILNVTGNGSSFIGLNGSANPYGILLNDNNIFTNSYTVLVPAGASFGIYYTDNGTPVIQTSSRITVTIASAGQQGPTGSPGATSAVSVTSRIPSAVQSITASTETLLLWATLDSGQTQGVTGLTYSAGLWTNGTALALPLLVEYQVLLDVTNGGATYLKVNGTTNYGTMLTDNNSFTNSYVILLPAGQTLGIYYMDNGSCSVQTGSRATITLLVAGMGPTGVTGPIGQVATLDVTPTTTQVIPASTNTVIRWGTIDATQSTGTTGLTYSAGTGLFTNSTGSTLPLLVEYTLITDVTGTASSYIGVNGAANAYGVIIHTTNITSNSFTVLVPAGATVGIYYTDNASPTVQITSRLSMTVLVAGSAGATGFTGPTGPVGQVATYTANPASTQSIGASTLTAIRWDTQDVAQSQGSTGLTYSAGTGLFTNSTTGTLPLLVEYSVYLNTTLGGYSLIGVNGSIAAFGGMYNDSNWFTNSYTVLVPAGQTVGIYYTDNGACVVQTASRIRLSLLTAGPQGPTGATGMGLWQPQPATSNIYYSAGYVGIGTTQANAALQVNGVPTVASRPAVVVSEAATVDLTNYATLQLVRPSTFDGKAHLSFIRDQNSVLGMGFWSTTNTFGMVHNLLGGAMSSSTGLFMTTTGSVGIGFTNPIVSLDVNGAVVTRNQNPCIGFMGDVDGAKYTMKLGSSRLSFGNDSGSFTGFESTVFNGRTYQYGVQMNSAGGMDVKGTVNIGTTTTNGAVFQTLGAPSANGIVSVVSNKTTLSSVSGSYDILQRWNEPTSNVNFMDLTWLRTSTGSDWTTASMRFQAKVDSTWMGYMEMNGSGGGTGGGLAFGTGNSNISPSSITERMCITSAGNVGVGTTNPGSILHVNNGTTLGSMGSAIILSNYLGNSATRPAVSTGVTNTSIWASNSSAPTADDGFMRIAAGGGTGADTKSYIDLSGYSTVAEMDRNIVFGTAGVERMRIIVGGNVGIGITNPSALLHVNGTCLANLFTSKVETVGAFSFTNAFTITIPYPASYLFSVNGNGGNIAGGSGDGYIKAIIYISIGSTGTLLTTIVQNVGIQINSYNTSTQQLSYNIGYSGQQVNIGSNCTVSALRLA